MLTRRRFLAASGSTLALIALPLRAFAQIIQKNARVIVGFPAGGPTDVVARLIADKLRGTYAPSLIVDNRPGGGGRVGAQELKSSEADGSSMLLTPASMIVLYPHVFKKLTYEPLRDFAPVTTATVFNFALSVGPGVPPNVKTLADFVQWCKANPQQATYGSPGAGSIAHFVGVLFARAAGFNFTHVPFKGVAPAVQDLLGGQIPSAITVVADVIPHLNAGRIRTLAISGTKRSQFLPEVPTFAEAGYKGVEAQEWFGFFVPAKTPSEIVTKLAGAIEQTLKAPDVSERLTQLGYEPVAMKPEKFAEVVKAEYDRWGPIVKESGFSADENRTP